MLRVFDQPIVTPEKFVIILELVPGRQSTGRSVDTIVDIAKYAFDDGWRTRCFFTGCAMIEYKRPYYSAFHMT